jgi:polyisoprenoid-binding protein YceI
LRPKSALIKKLLSSVLLERIVWQGGLMFKMFLSASVFIFMSYAMAASEATFDVHLIPAGDFTGRTNDVSGTATMIGNKVQANNIHVSLKNIKTGVEVRDKHTQKHLETDKYPDAILVHGEGENGQGKGLLKIKDTEKEVAGTYKVIGNELAAQFKIKLSDYKITGIKYMGVGVDDDVTLNVKVPITQGASAAAAPPKAPAKAVGKIKK